MSSKTIQTYRPKLKIRESADQSARQLLPAKLRKCGKTTLATHAKKTSYGLLWRRRISRDYSLPASPPQAGSRPSSISKIEDCSPLNMHVLETVSVLEKR